MDPEVMKMLAIGLAVGLGMAGTGPGAYRLFRPAGDSP